ncbi:DUF6093 family protein [Bifidobacterium mongoliense]|uniref:Phage associated protein n=1 Tax=Bifidobacterium mongoliense TaxID=518643 RepID=A0A423UE10_9BIFI|nr:DUF6093 family protein [Bifidobacterium mongoliense]MDN5980119.1 DUF6093 family protein [Bifidobacterium mongoliense]ROT86941.1 phage associated protein [Bifidobacterium mongoliense]
MDVLTMMRTALPRLRNQAERLMTDQFTIQRYTGRHVTDPDTGVDVQEMMQVADSKGKVQTSGGIASQVVTASGDSSNVGGNVPVWSLYLHFPVTLTGLREKDVAVCTASDDPDLVGRKFRLVNMQSEKSHATARRWNVQEMPEGD